MTRRTSRFNMPPDPASVFQALRTCRQAMIGVQAKVRANASVCHSPSMIMAAISTMMEQERQAEAQRDAIQKAEKS